MEEGERDRDRESERARGSVGDKMSEERRVKRCKEEGEDLHC